MVNARHVLQSKGDSIAALPPTARVLAAAQLMNDRQIGSVLVAEGERLVGIFTERDVLRRIVAEQLDPATTVLHEVMTTPVACGTPETTLDELRRVMRDQRIRHIPIVDNDRVIGMISIGDLNKVEHDTQVQTIQYLEQYMSVL